jgi:hypothetical protein
MGLFEGLTTEERRAKKAELENLVKDSVCLMPKTKYQIQEYLQKYGWNVDISTLENYALRLLDYTTYGEIYAKKQIYIRKPYGAHGSTKLFLPKDPGLKERAVRNMARQ